MSEEGGLCHIGRGEPHPATGREGQDTTDHLCVRHLDSLARMLHEVEAETDDLDAVPSMALNYGSGGGHSSLASQRTPVRLDAVTLGDYRFSAGDSEDEQDRHASGGVVPALVVLAKYAGYVRDVRGLTVPTRTVVDCAGRWVGAPLHGPAYGLPCRHHDCGGEVVRREIAVPITVHTERQLLSRQLDWVAGQIWVVQFYTDVRALLGQLQRANGTVVAKPIPGRCPAVVDSGDGTQHRCGGPLWPATPEHTAGEWSGSATSAVKCGACTQLWEGPAAIARLALLLEQQRREAESE